MNDRSQSGEESRGVRRTQAAGAPDRVEGAAPPAAKGEAIRADVSPTPASCGCADGSHCGAGTVPMGLTAMPRRDFVRTAAVGGVGLALRSTPMGSIVAGPFVPQDHADHFVPADKKLSPEWVRTLFARGESTWYAGSDLATIGMPVGGLCAGQVYLTGDGRLVDWHVFNENQNTGYGATNYEVGRTADETVTDGEVTPSTPLMQGFAVRVVAGGRSVERSLDALGFPEVRFCGEYPMARVEYTDRDFPVEVRLEAFSPFVPLDADASTLPASILRYTVRNTGVAEAEVTLAGWLENVTCLHHADLFSDHFRRVNGAIAPPRMVGFVATAHEVPVSPRKERAPIVLADFEGADYGDWTVQGQAFGGHPAAGTLPDQSPVSGYEGKGLVDSYLGGDDPQGRLVSPSVHHRAPVDHVPHRRRQQARQRVPESRGGRQRGPDRDGQERGAPGARKLGRDGPPRTEGPSGDRRPGPGRLGARQRRPDRDARRSPRGGSRACAPVARLRIAVPGVGRRRRVVRFGASRLAPRGRSGRPEGRYGEARRPAPGGRRAAHGEDRPGGGSRDGLRRRVALPQHVPRERTGGEPLRRPLRRGRRGGGPRGGAPRRAHRGDTPLASHVVRQHAPPLAPGSAPLHGGEPRHHHGPVVGGRPLLGVGGGRVLPRHVRPRVELRARAGAPLPGPGAFGAGDAGLRGRRRLLSGLGSHRLPGRGMDALGRGLPGRLRPQSPEGASTGSGPRIPGAELARHPQGHGIPHRPGRRLRRDHRRAAAPDVR